MEQSFQLTLQIVIAVVAGIGAQVLGQLLKVPSIVLLLLFGTVLGGSGMHILHPDDLGVGLEVLVALTVAIILFEGGLNLELGELGKVSGSLRNLVTVGTIITLLGGAIAAHFLAEFPWKIAFLYASLVTVTGPTVISPLLKQVQVDKQVAALLEGEGVLIDPVGAILAVVVLDTILNAHPSLLETGLGLVLRLGIGSLIGFIGGWLMAALLKQGKLLSDDLKNLVVLAGLWGLFALAQSIRSESGLMATVVAGIVLRGSAVPQERLLRRFKGQLTILGISVLFILLSADLSIASMLALGWGSVFAVLALMLVVRPINIWICTWKSDLNWRQKLFVAWISPRGIVSASVASLFAILLTQRGLNGGEAIKALVFLTIIMTVCIQGLTANWVAQWLQITSSEVTGAMIVGCSPLSRLLALLWQEQGELVVLVDTDPEACRQAEVENIRVVLSSGLDHEALAAAGLESLGTFLAMTNSGEVNFVLAMRAAEEFRPPRVLAVFANDTEATNVSQNKKVSQAFLPQVSLKTWNQYITDGQVKLGKTTLKEPDFSAQQAQLQALIDGGELLPLLIKRDDRLQVALAQPKWQPGDRLVYLLYDSRPQLLKMLSGANSTTRLALGILPEVEEMALQTIDGALLVPEMKLD
ncbi:cation:proton antiporter [Merismopedia glauca]|uniref:Sodium:proton antiporter n=1 Tax=Merismopedia glauca CCAP 1448/3 TaxID=1296344 RepID=A0A2T1CA88_9CYAN|nr:sodium:proton antiporter [Merismopedia glauca]PSB05053.1 sodium:proton antiporter [Merismopedia glauca CCAP 1448/3]